MSNNEIVASQVRLLTRSGYELQKQRIQSGNRIVGNLKARLGQASGMSEEKLEADALKLLKDLRTSHDRISDAVAKSNRAPKAELYDGIISSLAEYTMANVYLSMLDSEERTFKNMGRIVVDHVLWEFLKDVKGCGVMMAGVIISCVNIHLAEYPSSLWALAGLDVAHDGRGRSKRAEHLVDREYTNAKGEQAVRKSITFNPFFKTKLMGVLASGFLKCPGSKYDLIYRNYKHRLQCDPRHAEKSDGHRHQMAMRYMMKMFLVDLYNFWRKAEGLPVAPTYAEGKLGMAPHREGSVNRPTDYSDALCS